MSTLKKIYSDLDLTFNRVPVTSDVALSYDEQSVIRSVRNLLLTNTYDRLFQPQIGSNVTKLLFENIDPLTASLLQNEITNTITNFEPRVSIISVIVQTNIDQNAYNVSLTFFIGNNSSPTAVNLLLQRSR
jgi:phage baseplate assembly protein W